MNRLTHYENGIKIEIYQLPAFFKSDEKEFKEFLKDFLGENRIDTVFEPMYSFFKEPLILFHIDNKLYHLHVDNGVDILKEYNKTPISDILSKERFITNEDINKIFNHFKDNIDYVELSEVNYEGLFIGKQNDYYFKTIDEFTERIKKICGKTLTKEIMKRLEDALNDNSIHVMFGNFRHYKLILNDDNTPTLKSVSNPFFNALKKECTNVGMTDEEVASIAYSGPKWIPKNCKHLTGDINSGYVVVDPYGNEFVYIPSLNKYLSRDYISLGKDDKFMSIPNTKPMILGSQKGSFSKSRSNLPKDYISVWEEDYVLHRDPHIVYCNKFNNDTNHNMAYNIQLSDEWSVSDFTIEDPDPDPLDSAYNTVSYVTCKTKLMLRNGILTYDITHERDYDLMNKYGHDECFRLVLEERLEEE